MNAFLKKLTSRKFLLSIISMAAGLAALCGADEAIVSVVAGALMTVLPAVVYCITEGRIDAAAALGADKQVQTVLQAAGDVLASLDEDNADKERD